MIDLLTNTNGDLTVNNSDLVLVTGIDRVVQAIRIKLKFFYGEWFLDTTYGIKYQELIFIKNPNVNIVDDALKAAIVDDPDVLELIKFESDIDNQTRVLTVSFVVNTIYGIVTIESEKLL